MNKKINNILELKDFLSNYINSKIEDKYPELMSYNFNYGIEKCDKKEVFLNIIDDPINLVRNEFNDEDEEAYFYIDILKSDNKSFYKQITISSEFPKKVFNYEDYDSSDAMIPSLLFFLDNTILNNVLLIYSVSEVSTITVYTNVNRIDERCKNYIL